MTGSCSNLISHHTPNQQSPIKPTQEAVVPSIRAGKRVVVVGHENNLRGLLMHLEGISEARIPQLEIPRAVPLRYQVRAVVSVDVRV